MREIQLSLMEKEDKMTTQENYKYDDFLKILQKINPVAYALVKPHTKVLEFSPQKILLGVRNSTFVKKIDSKGDFLKQAAGEYFGTEPDIWLRLLSPADFKPENSKKKWTRKEKKFLRENYATTPNEILAKELNRTPLAVQLQASVMGVKKRPEKRKAPKPITVVTELDWSDIKKPDLTRYAKKKNIHIYFIIANIFLNLMTLFILIFML